MRRRVHTGFTLIEAMITVAVLAILTAMALPSYSSYLMRGKIPEATTALSALRVQLEQYYQDHRHYGATHAGCGVPVPAATAHFSFQCTHGASQTNQSFLLTASGMGSMQGFAYTLDQDNQRQTTAVPPGWGTAPLACWVLKKGGGC